MKQLDECSRKYLQILYKRGYANLSKFSLEKVRNNFSGTSNIFKPDDVFKIDHKGYQIPVHIYVPAIANPNSIIIFFHSGGFVLRNWSINSHFCRRIVDTIQSCVMLVEYSLSPEAKFPIAIQEATAVIEWITQNREKIIRDRNKIDIYCCGESSGANLLVSALINKKNLYIKGIILICPSLDYHNQYASKKEFSTGYLLDIGIRKWFADQYLNAFVERSNPLVSPILSDKLRNLHNILILNSYFDPLRDEAIEFKNKLCNFGVKNRIETFDTIHGFLSLNIEPYASKALEIIAQFINHTV